ncbi:sugar ABC transporter ATP-binding protein [Herbiconiux sp. 11R-BC]|uniref:sugar ABC transporter ATP-binding protein n=1 Tax=Herbiconiux sp. 11R-BC TaxID=3111637 RepID=UPI003C0DD7B0
MTDVIIETHAPLLQARDIVKSFGPVKAVRSISLDIRVGEVLGLVGENGAGKSTLLSLMSGTLSPDSGELVFNGKPTQFDSYRAATESGIFRIFQHQALVPNMSVAENVYLAHEKAFTRFGIISQRSMVKKTQEIFDELSVELDPSADLDSLKFAERQVVEIVRSLAQARLLGITHPVILHDEPTSALSREQIEFFFDFVRRIKHQAAQVFVSHRLDEIIELCDRMVVLKDGSVVSVQDDPTALTEKAIHSLMVGREAERHSRAARTNEETEPRLELTGFSGEGFSDISLTILPGEVLGVAGVVGSGKSDLGRAVFELGQGSTGSLKVNGVVPARQGARAGIRASLGYVSNERHRDGIIAGMSVSHNISLPEIGAALGPVIVSGSRETTNADTAIKDLNIKAPGPDTLVGNLSGGNQQKVLLARWITLGSKLLVLDNPTNGVDVGAKAEIYRIIEGLTQQGVSVMLISDDLPEILSMSDRIVVMKDGKVTSTVAVDVTAPPAEVDLVAAMV